MEIMIFGTPTCGQCVQVQNFLTRNNVDYSYRCIGPDIQLIEVERIVQRIVKSVPVIVVDGKEVTIEQLKSTVTLRDASL